MINARPHPEPLPRGEETAMLNSWKFVDASRESSRGFAMEVANVSPSPWGEGRGEGGRRNSMQSHGNY